MAAKKSGFQMVNSRWPPKSPDFKWSIQDGSQKLLLRHLWSVFECHLLTDPLSTIRNPDTSGFQIPTVPLTDIYFFWSGRKPHVTIFLNKKKGIVNILNLFIILLCTHLYHLHWAIQFFFNSI